MTDRGTPRVELETTRPKPRRRPIGGGACHIEPLGFISVGRHD